MYTYFKGQREETYDFLNKYIFNKNYIIINNIKINKYNILSLTYYKA